MMIVLNLVKHNSLPKNSRLSIVFLAVARSSFEPTEGRIIGGCEQIEAKMIADMVISYYHKIRALEKLNI